MRTRRLKLFVAFVTFILLFSLQGFSQAEEPSAHPLLDKYYPQKKVDTSKAVTTTRATAVPDTKPVFDATPVLPANAQIKPVPPPEPVAETKPVSNPEPVAETKPAPAAKSISEIDSIAAVKDTTAVNKPNTPVVVVPARNQVQARLSESLYMDRMGSSSPLYDTYEKNRNGVGSVTTNPK